MSSIRFIMIGGFLGAGKTTTLGRLAKHYMDRGQKVGIVTNDQAEDLVDTHTLRQQGFAVEEVAGACFCCKFEDLIDKVAKFEAADRPDVILAEPVGSCTDLVATVVQPLKDLYDARFDVAPYAVLFKPSHGLKILRDDKGSGFSPKAAYIFRKQLEEADAIVINRIDEMSPAEGDELLRLLGEQFPGTPVLRASAKTGQGFDALTELLQQEGVFGNKILDIDYDIYADGEAELGWLNSRMRLQCAKPISLDSYLLDVAQELQSRLKNAGAEVAHLKTIGLWDGAFGVANLVNSQGKVELSLPSRCTTNSADIIVNARVAIDPKELAAHLDAIIEHVGHKYDGTVSGLATQSFRPGRPTPTHRYSTAQ